MARKKIPFPTQGSSIPDLLKELESLQKKDVDWIHGKAFAYVYHYTDELKNFLKKVNNMFFSANALNPMAFPSLKKFEAESISMIADLFHGNSRVCGNLTSGGTESILLAVKTYRDWARKKLPHIKRPEMILPMSVHPAFNKAAHYFDITMVYVPLDDQFRPDLKAVEAALSDNTILIVGSACDFPRGGVDPIPEMAAIAEERGIGFHTDACVGGFILPFLRKLGYSFPKFDFEVPGVTSISADLHKYGHGPKGCSSVVFRTAKLWKNQFHAYTDWTGGIYASPTMMGTRPGGAIAGGWAVLKYMGEEGYLKSTQIAMQATEKLMEGIKQIPDLCIIGTSQATLFSFTTKDPAINIYAVGDIMAGRGWIIDKMQVPKALHLLISPIHINYVDAFLSDLREAVAEIKANPQRTIEGEAAMYGMMATFKNRKKLEDVVIGFLADQYKSR
jgi:sphinganine-1-phosphate aldolase